MGRGQQGVYRFYIDKLYQKKLRDRCQLCGPKKRIQYLFRLYDELWMRAPGLGTYLKCRNVYLAYSVADGGIFWWRSNGKNLLIFAIPVLNILICLVSPVNGMIRYMWPVMTIMPMLFWWILQPAPKIIFKLKMYSSFHKDVFYPECGSIPSEIWIEPSLFIFLKAAADSFSGTSDGAGDGFLCESELIGTGICSFIQKKGCDSLSQGHKKCPFDSCDHIWEMFSCPFVDEISR